MDFDALSDLSSPLSSIPSSPLSSAPASPELPPGWFPLSPPPSQDAGEDMPPARKRRKVDQKVRTTRHLDLTSETAQSEYDRQEATDALYEALHKRRKIVVIAGAGISVSAGIPDFRSSHGLFRSLRDEHKLKSSGKELFDASVYKDDSSTSSFHDMVRKLSRMSENAQPTAFHRLLARLAVEGRLLRLYTQNVDGIETSLPPLATTVPLNHKGPWPHTIQLHGGLEKMMCQKCRHVSEFQAALFQGPTPPLCPECVTQDALRTAHAGKRSHGIGRLRPRIVLYNEHNPDEEAIGAVTTSDLRSRPDAVIVVGTSLKIGAVRRIVREMCGVVRDRKCGDTIWINHDPVPPRKEFEDCFDLIIRGDSDEVAKIAGFKEWNDFSKDTLEEYTESDLQRIKSSQGEVQVVIPATPKKMTTLLDETNAMMSTPPRSQDGDPSDRTMMTKRKAPAKSSPLKPVPAPATLIKIPLFKKNPASSGRSLSEVLGKENKRSKKPAGQAKGLLNKKMLVKDAQTVPRQGKILAKVTKTISRPAKAEKRPSEPLSPHNDYNFLPPPTYSSAEATPVPETPPARDWDNREMISPTGSIPPDMKRLLN